MLEKPKKNKNNLDNRIKETFDNIELKKKRSGLPKPDKTKEIMATKISKNYKVLLENLFEAEGTNASVEIRKFLLKYLKEHYK